MQHVKKLAALAAIGLIAGPAFAQDYKGPQAASYYLGGLIGAVVPLDSDADTDLAFGAEAGYHLVEQLAGGVYFSTSSDSAGTGVFETSTSGSILAAFGDYYFSPQLHVGALVGLAIGSVDAPGDAFDDTSTDLALGGRAGFEVGMAEHLTVGPEANIVFSTADNADPILNILGAVRYRF